MNKLILVLLALLLAATYAVRIQTQNMNQIIPPGLPSKMRRGDLQIDDNGASLDDLCELCFGGDENSRVQLKDDEGFDCETIVDDCFDDDGSS